MEQFKDALFEFLPANGSKPGRPRAGGEVLNYILREAAGVDLDQLDQLCRDHDGSPWRLSVGVLGRR
jgi:hypothetical protein